MKGEIVVKLVQLNVDLRTPHTFRSRVPVRLLVQSIHTMVLA